MIKMSRKGNPLELVDVILKHKPGASVAMISEVVSEWGDLFDDQKATTQKSIDVESAAPNGGQSPPS
jgi:hypothetical protein